MTNFMWNLMMCMLAGGALAAVFSDPAGIVGGMVGGLFVGFFVGWGKLKTQAVPVWMKHRAQ